MFALAAHGKNIFVVFGGPCVRLVASQQCNVLSKFCSSSLTRYLSSEVHSVSEVTPKVKNKEKKRPKVQNKKEEHPKVQNKNEELAKVQNKNDELPKVQNKNDELPKVQNKNDELPKIQNKNEARPLWYYQNLAIRERKLNQLIRKSLEIEKGEAKLAEATVNVKHMLDILSVLKAYDFNTKEVSKLIFKKPHVFSLSKRELAKRLEDFECDYGYPKNVLKKMITRSPALLIYDEKKASLKTRINTLKEINLFPKLTDEKVIFLIQKCPGLLTITEKSVFNARLGNLAKLGMNKQILYELVTKHPDVLTCSEKSVSEKVNYVKHAMGGRATLFVKFPRAFTASLQRIRERHLYLEKEGYFVKGKTFTNEKKLRAIVLTTDKDFVSRVTRTSMKDYREFQRELRKREGGGGEEVAEVEDQNDDNDNNDDENEDEDHNYDNEYGDEEDNDDEDEDEDDEDRVDNDDEDNDEDVEAYERPRGNEKYMNSFGSSQRPMSDEEWYNTPFPPIAEPIDADELIISDDNDGGSRKPRRTSSYKPFEKKHFTNNRYRDYDEGSGKPRRRSSYEPFEKKEFNNNRNNRDYDEGSRKPRRTSSYEPFDKKEFNNNNRYRDDGKGSGKPRRRTSHNPFEKKQFNNFRIRDGGEGSGKPNHVKDRKR